MASYQLLLGELAGKTGPASPSEIAKGLNLKPNDVATPLKRMAEKNPPWVTVNDEGEYTITEDGKKEVSPITEESEGITEYQQFLSFGIAVGVPKDIAKLTADHVWRAGDFNDLNWVLTGLTEQGIRKDLRERWFHLWRGYLHQPISPELAELLKQNKESDVTKPPTVTDSKDSVKGGARLRDYIIDASQNPLFVGEGNGDLEYADAVRITTIRAASAARISVAGADGEGGAKGSRITDATELLEALQKLGGGAGKGKTVLMMQTENGYELKEIEAGSTVTIPRTDGGGKNVPSRTYVVDGEEVREIEAGKPMVIIKKELSGSGDKQPAVTKNFLYKEDGSMVEIEAGKPIIITQQSKPNNSGTMLNAITPDGKSIVIDIDSYFKLEDHKAKMEHDKESHDMKMDIGKGLKDLVTKGVKALGNMSDEET